MPTISIGFQIQNKGNGLQELILDADSLKNMLSQTVTEAKKLEDKMVNFGSVSIGLDALSSAFQQLQGFTKDFTSAYDTQMEAERQLEQVMHNTMGARAEDVQSIKDFCSAQQEIGIVGDEVQLAGAQEMATYVTMKGTLKTLIPVMNDMVAQHRRLHQGLGLHFRPAYRLRTPHDADGRKDRALQSQGTARQRIHACRGMRMERRPSDSLFG